MKVIESGPDSTCLKCPAAPYLVILEVGDRFLGLCKPCTEVTMAAALAGVEYIGRGVEVEAG